MAEFALDMPVVIADLEKVRSVSTVAELLPGAFRPTICSARLLSSAMTTMEERRQRLYRRCNCIETATTVRPTVC